VPLARSTGDPRRSSRSYRCRTAHRNP
jgi:hypothetical protein